MENSLPPPVFRLGTGLFLVNSRRGVDQTLPVSTWSDAWIDPVCWQVHTPESAGVGSFMTKIILKLLQSSSVYLSEKADGTVHATTTMSLAGLIIDRVDLASSLEQSRVILACDLQLSLVTSVNIIGTTTQQQLI